MLHSRYGISKAWQANCQKDSKKAGSYMAVKQSKLHCLVQKPELIEAAALNSAGC